MGGLAPKYVYYVVVNVYTGVAPISLETDGAVCCCTMTSAWARGNQVHQRPGQTSRSAGTSSLAD